MKDYLFEYTVESLGEKTEDGGIKTVETISYYGTDFESCEPTHAIVNILPSEATTTLQAYFTCFNGGAQIKISTALVISAGRDKSTIFSRFLRGTSDESIFRPEYINASPIECPVYLSILGFGLDVQNTLYFTRPLTADQPEHPYVRHLDLEPHCLSQYIAANRLGSAPNENCTDLRRSWEIKSSYRSYASGRIVNVALESATADVVMRNILHVFVSGALTDLGFNNHMFSHPDLLARTIDPSYDFNETTGANWTYPHSETKEYRSPFATQYLDPNYRDRMRIVIPIDHPFKESRTIKSSYLCRRWRRKPWTSFFGSVVSATVSILLGIWAGFKVLTTELAKRRDQSRNYCTCPVCSGAFVRDADDQPLIQRSPSAPTLVGLELEDEKHEYRHKDI